MSQFLSNLPPPSKSRFSHGPSATSGGQPLVPSSVMVPALIVVLTPSLNGAGSLALVPSHGYKVHEDGVPLVEYLELAH